MVNEFKLTVVHFARPNQMQICACAWIYRCTKKTAENQDWGTGPPGRRAVGLPGREAVAGRGPRAAGQKKKGLLLAKPVIMAVVEGRIFLLAYRRTVF